MDKEIGNGHQRCDAVLKQKFINEVDEDFEESLGKGFDLLPLYENGMFEHAFKSHYSLERNEHLRCRWDQYKKDIQTREYAPFQLPDISELHFYNCAIRFHPPASIRNQDLRKKMRTGPGVDKIGQIPIPLEAARGPTPAQQTQKKILVRGGKKERKNKN